MAIKIFRDSQWKDAELSALQNGMFSQARLKRRSADGWDKIYPEKEVITKVYPVARAKCYRNNLYLYDGSIICGYETGSSSDVSSWTMLLFNTDFVSELANREILGVRLYIRRQLSTSGSASTYINVWLHNYEGTESVGKNRDYSNNAKAIDSVKAFQLNEGKWLDLYTSVGEKLRDGTYRGLSIDHGNSTTDYETGFYSADDCKLEIAYLD